MTPEPILEVTQRLAAKCPRTLTLSKIAQDAGLEEGWVSAFFRNKINDPGVKKVQKLHDYLIKVCDDV